MTDTYTIAAVGDKREWSNDHGAFWAYPLTLEDSSGQKHLGVEWSRKQSSRAPEPGERIVGEIKGGPHGEKIKVDFDATKALSGAGSTGSSGSKNYSSKEWQPESQRDPERAARILRQHSQEIAVRMLVGNGETNFNVSDIAKLADELDQDVIAAGQKAAQAGGASSEGSRSPSSLDGRTPPAAQDNSEYLAKLLESAGFDVAQTPVVQRYIETQFDNDRRTKVEVALKDITKASDAHDILLKETEEWAGEKLPVHDPAGDEIPF